MRKLDDLNLWRVFINLAQTRNFSCTAAELGVDVSTVSRMLTTLEKAVGRSLLVRNARPLELTELGQRALDLMSDQIRRQAEIIDELQGPNTTMQGVLRLGAPYSLEIEFLGEALLRFQKKFPLVEFRVSGGSGMTELMNRQVDIIFCDRGGHRKRRRPRLFAEKSEFLCTDSLSRVSEKPFNAGKPRNFVSTHGLCV